MKQFTLRSTIFLLCFVLLFVSLPFAQASADADASLDELVSGFMQKYKLNENNFSFAYYNTVTGETYLFNEHKLMYGASLYKLPLNMYYYEQEALGNISSSAKFAGRTLSDCHKLSLQFSDNVTSVAMQGAIGTYGEYKSALDKYTGVSAVEIGGKYLNDNYFNSFSILNTLKYLYDNADFFSEAIGYLKAANPGAYFKRYVRDYEIAQKYGWLLPSINTAGIVYTPTPYLLCVFTRNVSGAESVIGRLNELLCEYTVTRNVGAVIAEPSFATVLVNGKLQRFDAYNINDNNYFKLRDIAYIANGTKKQFEVSWDEENNAIALTSKKPYTPAGGEMTIKASVPKIVMPTASKIYLDGQKLTLKAYKIGDNNYFKLRDLAAAINFGVDWDETLRTVKIDLNAPYFP